MGKINDYVAHVYKKYADLDGSKLRTLAKKTFFSDLGFITNETIPPMKKYLKKKKHYTVYGILIILTKSPTLLKHGFLILL